MPDDRVPLTFNAKMNLEIVMPVACIALLVSACGPGAGREATRPSASSPRRIEIVSDRASAGSVEQTTCICDTRDPSCRTLGFGVRASCVVTHDKWVTVYRSGEDEPLLEFAEPPPRLPNFPEDDEAWLKLVVPRLAPDDPLYIKVGGRCDGGEPASGSRACQCVAPPEEDGAESPADCRQLPRGGG